MRFCEECGAQLEDGVKFCEECGTAVEEFVIEDTVEEATVIESNNKSTDKQTVEGKQKKKKGTLFLIIGIIASIVLIMILILVFGENKEDESDSKKDKKDKQVEETKESDVDETQKDNSIEKEDSITNREQQELISIFDVGFGGDFFDGTYTVESRDGLYFSLEYSPMFEGGCIRNSDWTFFTGFDLQENLLFDTEYSSYSYGVDEDGDSCTYEVTYTIQKDGIWIYWCYYDYRDYCTVLFDGFISSEYITCTSTYKEYEWGLETINEKIVPLTDRDSRYVYKRIEGGEVRLISYYGYGDNDASVDLSNTIASDYYDIYIYNGEGDSIYFMVDTPIYYGEENKYLGEYIGDEYSGGWYEELDYIINANGEKIYDVSKYDDYVEVCIKVTDKGIDVYWCEHGDDGSYVAYDGRFEAEVVERTTIIKNY